MLIDKRLIGTLAVAGVALLLAYVIMSFVAHTPQEQTSTRGDSRSRRVEAWLNALDDDELARCGSVCAARDRSSLGTLEPLLDDDDIPKRKRIEY